MEGHSRLSDWFSCCFALSTRTYAHRYQQGLARRALADWLFVASEQKRERSIESSKRQTWSKINQWLEELDQSKVEKRELASKVQRESKTLLNYLSGRDYTIPFSFEDKIDLSAIK